MYGAEQQMYLYLQRHTIQGVLDSASFDRNGSLHKK